MHLLKSKIHEKQNVLEIKNCKVHDGAVRYMMERYATVHKNNININFLINKILVFAKDRTQRGDLDNARDHATT